jgi:hypothetical protein
MDPSPEYYRPRATQSTSSSSTPPTTGGRRGAEHSALSLLGSRSQSVRYYLRTIIPRRRHCQRAIGGAEAEVVVVAGRVSSGRRGSGGGDNRVMFCVVLRSRLELCTVCLLRFGVNRSFYLNAKKIRVCRLVQNLTSLLTSSVQAPYMFHTSTTYRRCQKIDNVHTL